MCHIGGHIGYKNGRCGPEVARVGVCGGEGTKKISGGFGGSTDWLEPPGWGVCRDTNPFGGGTYPLYLGLPGVLLPGKRYSSGGARTPGVCTPEEYPKCTPWEPYRTPRAPPSDIRS